MGYVQHVPRVGGCHQGSGMMWHVVRAAGTTSGWHHWGGERLWGVTGAAGRGTQGDLTGVRVWYVCIRHCMCGKTWGVPKYTR